MQYNSLYEFLKACANEKEAVKFFERRRCRKAFAVPKLITAHGRKAARLQKRVADDKL